MRWSDGVKALDFKLQGVVGDSLVSAGVVAYLGAFNTKYRHNIIDKWADECRIGEIG